MPETENIEIVVRTRTGDFVESFGPSEHEAARAYANDWFDKSGEQAQVIMETTYCTDKKVLYSTDPEDPDFDDEESPFA